MLVHSDLGGERTADHAMSVASGVLAEIGTVHAPVPMKNLMLSNDDPCVRKIFADFSPEVLRRRYLLGRQLVCHSQCKQHASEQRSRAQPSDVLASL